MSTVALIQKPLDILNAMEYCHIKQIPSSSVNWIVIGVGTRQRAAISFLTERGWKARYIIDPDLLSHDRVVKLLGDLAPRQGRVVRSLLLPLAFTHWHAALLIHLTQLRPYRDAELVVLDAWRSKLGALVAMPRSKQCFIDGGFSTETFGLREAFEAGGARALVRQALLHQRSLFIPWIRRAILAKIDREAVFFSAYWTESAGGNAILNDYSYFASCLRAGTGRSGALVLGYPDFRHAAEACAFAAEWLRSRGAPAEIVYRPHPRDLVTKDPGEFAQLEQRLREQVATGIRLNRVEMGLELDLLADETLPTLIFSYQSAARIVLEKREGIRWIDLPDFDALPPRSPMQLAP